LKDNISVKSITLLNNISPNEFFDEYLINTEKLAEKQLIRKNKNTIMDNMLKVKKRHNTVIPQTDHDKKLSKNQQKKENICIAPNDFNFKSAGCSNRILTFNNNENLTSNSYLNE
jgi:hypothetical protein